MFGHGFVEANILGNASGQPFVLGDFITHIGNFLSPDIAVWNTFFALIQLFIGVGLLFRARCAPRWRSRSSGCSASGSSARAWACSSPAPPRALTGAPGSVLMYGLIGLMAWPRPPRRFAVDWSDRPSGVATSRRRPGHRRVDHAAGRVGRVLVAGRRPLPAARQPHRRRRSRAPSSGMAAVVARVVRPLPHQPGQPVLDHRDADGLDPGRRRRSPSASARWSPAAPAGSSPPARCSPS